MGRPVLAVALAVLLALSGCGGLFGGGTPTPTVTPADVPTGSPTAPPARELAPGLTGDGIEDPWALAAAHDDALADISYTERIVDRTRGRDGTERGRVNTTAYVQPDPERSHSIAVSTSRPDRFAFDADRVEFYREGERRFVAITRANGTEYLAFDDPGAGRSMRLFLLFSSVETRVDGTVTRNDTELYRVRSVDLRAPDQFAAAVGEDDEAEVGNVTVRALVDQWGLVHEYEYAYTVARDGVERRLSRRVEYAALGRTTVERPDWYDEAVNATGTATAGG